MNNIGSVTFHQERQSIGRDQHIHVGTAATGEKEQLRKLLTELADAVQRTGPSTAGLVGEIQGAEQDLDRGDGAGVQHRLGRVREALVAAGAAQTVLQTVGAALELAAGMTG